MGRGKGRSVDPDTEGEGKQCGPRPRRGIAFWLRFGHDSVYNTNTVCVMNV